MKSAKVELSAQIENRFLFLPAALEVEEGTAERNGFPHAGKGSVCALDCLVAMHLAAFGPDEDLSEYIAVAGDGAIQMMFGIPTGAVGFSVNDCLPNDGVVSPIFGEYLGYFVGFAPVCDGDDVKFFFFGDSLYTDQACWFEINGEKTRHIVVDAGEKASLALRGYYFAYHGASPALSQRIFAMDGMQAGLIAPDGEIVPLDSAETGEGGALSLAFPSPGAMQVSAISLLDYRRIISPLLTVEVRG
jgi:hypothetical protein